LFLVFFVSAALSLILILELAVKIIVVGVMLLIYVILWVCVKMWVKETFLQELVAREVNIES
jgi:hypothetical protein